MKAYLIRNQEGLFFRAYNRAGPVWTDNISDALIHSKPTPLRSTVTQILRRHAGIEIIEAEISLKSVKALDERDRNLKVLKAEISKARREMSKHLAWHVKHGTEPGNRGFEYSTSRRIARIERLEQRLKELQDEGSC